MGRRKIEIQPIAHERNRAVTFLKRKNGLFKKAYELGVLCSVDVAVIIFEDRPGHTTRQHAYSSTSLHDIVQKQIRFQGEQDLRTPVDFSGGGNTYGSTSTGRPSRGGRRRYNDDDDDEDDDDDVNVDEDDGDSTPLPSTSRRNGKRKAPPAAVAGNGTNGAGGGVNMNDFMTMTMTHPNPNQNPNPYALSMPYLPQLHQQHPHSHQQHHMAYTELPHAQHHQHHQQMIGGGMSLMPVSNDRGQRSSSSANDQNSGEGKDQNSASAAGRSTKRRKMAENKGDSSAGGTTTGDAPLYLPTNENGANANPDASPTASARMFTRSMKQSPTQPQPGQVQMQGYPQPGYVFAPHQPHHPHPQEILGSLFSLGELVPQVHAPGQAQRFEPQYDPALYTQQYPPVGLPTSGGGQQVPTERGREGAMFATAFLEADERSRKMAAENAAAVGALTATAASDGAAPNANVDIGGASDAKNGSKVAADGASINDGAGPDASGHSAVTRPSETSQSPPKTPKHATQTDPGPYTPLDKAVFDAVKDSSEHRKVLGLEWPVGVSPVGGDDVAESPNAGKGKGGRQEGGSWLDLFSQSGATGKGPDVPSQSGSQDEKVHAEGEKDADAEGEDDDGDGDGDVKMDDHEEDQLKSSPSTRGKPKSSSKSPSKRGKGRAKTRKSKAVV